jgi:hypothetical protein
MNEALDFVRVGKRLIELMVMLYIFLSNLKNIICKWLNSPYTKLFCFGSVLNSDSSICMNCSDSPWLLAIC